jgi:hypothetical protein
MVWGNWRDRLTGASSSGALVLTRSRIRSAYAVAIATDVLQFALGPFGWAGSDEVLDVVAMILTTMLIGFHPLLLPTFAIELVPIADILPTWTACVALVVAMKKKQAPPPSRGDDRAVTIDVQSTPVS